MNKLLALSAAALLSLSVPMQARAADVSIDVSAAFITGTIERAITRYLATGAPEFAWLQQVTHVEVVASATDPTTLHLRLNLRFRATVGPISVDVPVIVEADLAMRCDARGPFAVLINPRVVTLVPVPPEVVARIASKANQMLDAQTHEIIDPIWAGLGTLPDLADLHQVCPHVRIGPDGSLHAELDFVRGCINGTHRYRACGSRYSGEGHRYECDNGYWVLRSLDCEPAAPPRGQRP